MKKNNYSFVLFVLSIIVCLTSCNNEQTIDDMQKQSCFDRDLNHYVESQESIIKCVGRTRANRNIAMLYMNMRIAARMRTKAIKNV